MPKELDRALRILSMLQDEIKNDPPDVDAPDYITRAIIATCEFIVKELERGKAGEGSPSQGA